jgi:acetylglutamate kinase
MLESRLHSVIKVGGDLLGRPETPARLAAAVGSMDALPILVHGGGPAVDDLQGRLGQQPVKVDGMRRTDPQALESALMVLCGSVNKTLVGGLIAAGVPAFGLCGVDGGVVRCRRWESGGVDLGQVGEVVAVRLDVLEGLLDMGLVPVIAPLSLGLDGKIYNINADQVAGHLARACRAPRLDFVSGVSGVLVDGSLADELDGDQARRLIDSGAIRDGMVPKVRAALEALSAGVESVRVLDLDGLADGGGTTFRPRRQMIDPGG